MNKFSKILVSGLLCAAFAAGAAGCSSDTSNENQLTIKYLAKDFGQTWMETLAADFEAETGIDVKLIPDSSFETSFSKRVQSKSPEDLMYVYTYEWAALAEDYLEDLTDFAAETKPNGESGKTIEEMIISENKTFGKKSDRRYLIPVSTSPTGIIYNATLFEQKGWDKHKYFTEPTMYNFQDLVEVIIADGEVKPFAYSTAVTSNFDFVTVPLWAQYAGEQEIVNFIDFTEKAESFGKQGKAEGLGFYEQFFVNSSNGSDGKPANYMVASSNKKTQEAVIGGNAAMFVDGAWAERGSSAYIEAKGVTLKMMPMPLLCKRDSSGRYTNEVIAQKVDGEYQNFTYMSAEDYFCIPKNAKNKDLAMQFIEFALREDNLRKMHVNMGVPLSYEYSTDGLSLTPFQQSVLDIRNSTTGIYLKNTQNPMALYNKVSLHIKYTDPYAEMRKGKTAAQIVQEEHDYAVENWSRWESEINA